MQFLNKCYDGLWPKELQSGMKKIRPRYFVLGSDISMLTKHLLRGAIEVKIRMGYLCHSKGYKKSTQTENFCGITAKHVKNFHS